jgi:tRNA A37 threonylcarbamoyladenosine dehydratase
MKQRILDINPKARVTTHMTFYTPESSQETLIPGYDYIVDAIDNVAGKVDLAVKAEQMGLPIISSMGTGNKLDPTRLEVADIYDTSVCPLAKAVRKLLKERGVKSLKVVYSREQPIECGRVTGSLSFVPSVAGMILAAEVVKDLVGITPRP